jgi:hypothetical protein
MERVPDNNDLYTYYEKETERLNRLHNRYEYEQEFEIDELPFYMKPSEKDEFDD